MRSRKPDFAGYGVGAVVGGRYQIEMVLVQRTSSMLCAAVDLAPPHARVVIHSLPDPELPHRVELLRGLFRNAQIVNVLNRDDLLPILDFNVEPRSGTLFLVMPHRTDVPLETLVAIGGPETKTTAAFAEVARGLLESHDSGFFDQDADTNPGEAAGPRHDPARPRHDTAPPRSGFPAPVPQPRSAIVTPMPQPRSGTSIPMLPARTGPPPEHAAPMPPPTSMPPPTGSVRTAPRSGGAPRRAAPVEQPVHGQWQEAEDFAPAPPPPAPRSSRLTRIHIALIAAVTLLLVAAVIYGTTDQRAYYGPRSIQRSEWHDYYGDPGYDDREGIMSAGDRAPTSITVTSKPSGARVYAGYKRLGTTPVKMDRPQHQERVILRVSFPGYADQTLVLSPASPALVSVVLARTIGGGGGNLGRRPERRADPGRPSSEPGDRPGGAADRSFDTGAPYGFDTDPVDSAPPSGTSFGGGYDTRAGDDGF